MKIRTLIKSYPLVELVETKDKTFSHKASLGFDTSSGSVQRKLKSREAIAIKIVLITLFFISQINLAKASDNQMIQHGDDHSQIHHAFTAEADVGEARDGSAKAWNLDGWVGGDINRLWLKSERKDFGKYERKSEVQALYSKNIAPFWDTQFGVRHDFRTDFSNQTLDYLTLGFEGLAPGWFETDAHIFVSDQGNWSARLKQEVDIFITQKLITQPYFEADFFAQDVPKIEVKSGLAELEFGTTTRYEISRKFAPYFALRYHRKTFGTANLAKQIDERVDNFIAAIGVRVRF